MSSKAVLPHDSAGGRYLFLCKRNEVFPTWWQAGYHSYKTDIWWDRQREGTARTVRKSAFIWREDKGTKKGRQGDNVEHGDREDEGRHPEIKTYRCFKKGNRAGGRCCQRLG